MTHAQPQVNARNHSALLNHSIPESTIVASFFWPFSRADLACMLRVNHEHIRRVWDKAKERGDLPGIVRPARGFDLRQFAMRRAA